jgi:hypothetical protein
MTWVQTIAPVERRKEGKKEGRKEGRKESQICRKCM